MPATFVYRDALYHSLKRWGNHLPRGWSQELAMAQRNPPFTGDADYDVEERRCERNRQRVAELMENVFGASAARRESASKVLSAQGEG